MEYRHGSAYELPLPSDSVDVVIISDVLEHLHDLPRALAELTRVLRPGGLLNYNSHELPPCPRPRSAASP